MLRYLVFTEYKVLGFLLIYLAAQQHNFRFVPMLMCFSAQKSCHRLARSTYKLDFLFSDFSFGVLRSKICYVIFYQYIVCYLTKIEPGIRFQQPSLIKQLYFLILNIQFSYLDQVLVPIALVPFIYQNKAKKKNILKTLRASFMNNVHVRKACCPYKAMEQNAKFV